jgi:uncharacterized protein (TIGR02594 family)
MDAVSGVALRPQQAGYGVQADADAFGGSIGRGMEALASGVGDLGDAVARVKNLDNVNASKDAENSLGDWYRNAMYGEGGYATLEGRAAVDGFAKFQQEAEAKREELGKGLTPGAAKYYDQASRDRLNSVLNQSIQHQATERKSWFTDTSNARIDGFGNDALSFWKDPAKVNESLLSGIDELKQQADMHGWDKSVFEQRKLEFVSGVTKNIALQMAQNDPLAAEKYINDAGGRLKATDRMALTNALETPILQAKAQKNFSDWMAGNKPEPTPEKQSSGDPTRGMGGFALIDHGPTRITSTNIRGSQGFQQVASQLVGATEGANGAAISQFIKQACGINVDPRVTPWCAGFVNGVLGAQGIKGTGSLAARSFLNFGNATDNPKPGDIVVLGRGGDPSKGHVGFFQGYDANGRILVLGGNQGADGRVSVSSQSPDNLLGFRTAGAVTEHSAALPNYTPEGLAAIQEKLDAITDPKERAATQALFNSSFTMQKKQLDAQKEEAATWAMTQVATNPTFDITRMPIDTQTALGASGMSSLMEYQNKVKAGGNPVTDDHVLYDLQTQYANDPNGFAQQDLFQYRAKLSNQDWDKVTGWRQTALTDTRKAKEDGTALSQAMAQAQVQLRGIGLIKDKSDGGTDDKAVAQFQNTLSDELNDFQRKNDGKRPTPPETQAIINRLLLPLAITTKGKLYGTNTTNGFAFQMGYQETGATAAPRVELQDIPADVRATLRDRFERQQRRQPSDNELIGLYANIVAGTKMVQDPTPWQGPEAFNDDRFAGDKAPLRPVKGGRL